MSELSISTLTANNTTTNVAVVANTTTINSTGIFLDSGNGVINTTAIKVTSGASNTVIKNVTEIPSINVAGVTYTTITSDTMNVQIFTANSTWSKPSWATTGNELVYVEAWGPGGAGGNNTGINAGGGGGGFAFAFFKASQCNAICNVHVGRAGVSTNSVFFPNTTIEVKAMGGRVGQEASGRGGAGGGLGNTVDISPSRLGQGYERADIGTNTIFGGGGSSNATVNAGSSVYGGGGGAMTTRKAGDSIYGGGGGSDTGPAGFSVYGGRGGNSSVAPEMPGGGGAGAGSGVQGANGLVKVYTYRIV